MARIGSICGTLFVYSKKGTCFGPLDLSRDAAGGWVCSSYHYDFPETVSGKTSESAVSAWLTRHGAAVDERV